MSTRSIGAALAVALLTTTATAALAETVTYNIDPKHSSVGFSVKHMVISNVRGAFDTFEGKIHYDAENPSASSVDVTIQTASVNTKNDDRDEHLRGPDFFDAETNPTITFKSKSVSKSGEGFTATGDLTIRGVTKEVELQFVLNGPIQNPWGQTVMGIEIVPFKINRQDFGVKWNKNLDAGGMVVGDDVTIDIQVEAIKEG